MKIMIGNRLIISESVTISVFLNGTKEIYTKRERKDVFKICVQINDKNIDIYIHIPEFDRRCKVKNKTERSQLPIPQSF